MKLADLLAELLLHLAIDGVQVHPEALERLRMNLNSINGEMKEELRKKVRELHPELDFSV